MRRQPQFVRDPSGLWLPPPVTGGAPDSVTIPLTICTYIVEANPTANFGTHVNLEIHRAVGSKFGQNQMKSLLRCNLLDGGVPAGATIVGTSAFHFYVSSIFSYGTTEIWAWLRGAYVVNGQGYPWLENVVVWNHLSGYQGLPQANFLLPRTTGWNVVDDDDCTYGLMSGVLQFALDYGHEAGVVGDLDMSLWPGICYQEIGFTFNSDDAASNKPYLVVNYTVAPAGMAGERGFWRGVGRGVGRGY